ncbi:hypothetical protein NM688_g4494 [Phlebia brevispora]|uniref:Uncharacterized protein n=1 Tax=Phlebia brevispora TaxID=194682 RepID=A0ACC1T2T1_9APHY|nr:hypothetical protein NM688_g4494 [Phlebia brevispora]
MAAVLHSSTLGNLNTGVWTCAHDGAPNYTDPRVPIAASSPLSSSDTSDLTPSYNMGRPNDLSATRLRRLPRPPRQHQNFGNCKRMRMKRIFQTLTDAFASRRFGRGTETQNHGLNHEWAVALLLNDPPRGIASFVVRRNCLPGCLVLRFRRVQCEQRQAEHRRRPRDYHAGSFRTLLEVILASSGANELTATLSATRGQSHDQPYFYAQTSSLSTVVPFSLLPRQPPVFTLRPSTSAQENLRILKQDPSKNPSPTPHCRQESSPLKRCAYIAEEDEEDGLGTEGDEEIVLVESNHPSDIEDDRDLVILERAVVKEPSPQLEQRTPQPPTSGSISLCRLIVPASSFPAHTAPTSPFRSLTCPPVLKKV